MDDALNATDVRGRVRIWNAAAARLWGRPVAETLGRRLVELRTPSLGAAVARRLDEAERSRSIVHGGDVHETGPDGGPRIVSLAAWPLRDARGRMSGAARRVHEALKRAEAHWRGLLAALPEVVRTIDREATILWITRTVAGADPYAGIGSKVWDWIAPGNRERLQSLYDRVFQTGEPATYEVEGTGPQGRRSRYRTRVAPVQVGGEGVALVLYTMDLTERGRGADSRGKPTP